MIFHKLSGGIYFMRYTKSEEAMKVAETLMPGGVNSPVRAFKSVDTPAIFMDRGKGSKNL